MDFASPEARDWWSETLANNLHSTDLWIDMNEPAAFGTLEKTIPKDALHGDGVEHRNIHNLYGFYMQVS